MKCYFHAALWTTHLADSSCAPAAAHDVQQASALLQDMLADVVNGSDVASALAGLLEEETPIIAELRYGSRLRQNAVPLPTGRDSGYDGSTCGTSMDAIRGAQGQDAAADRDQDGMIRQQETPEEEEVGVDGSNSGDEEGVINKVLQQPEFQAFAEFVLDSACFSLLQESAAGNWQAPGDSTR